MKILDTFTPRTYRGTLPKSQAIEIYSRAADLGYKSTRAEWLAVFPDRNALSLFRAEVGNLTWPGTMGESPWSFAFSVAYKVGEGFSPSSREWYSKQLAAGCPYCTAEVEAFNIYSNTPFIAAVGSL